MSKATDFKFVVRVHVDIFSKRTNKNLVKGRGLAHTTCYKISHSDIGLSPKRVSATDMKFSIAYGCIWTISPKRTMSEIVQNFGRFFGPPKFLGAVLPKIVLSLSLLHRGRITITCAEYKLAVLPNFS